MSKIQGVYIASLDAKDIYLASQLSPEFGYEIKKDDKYKLNKFTNVFDYSLDLIKLRDVYKQVMKNQKFSFWADGKEYCPFVINVTFKYSVKKFNRLMPGVFSRVGQRVAKDDYDDCVCVRDGLLAGICTGQPVSNPIDEDLLENCFYICQHDDGTITYEDKTNIPTVYGVRDLRTMLYEDGFMFDGRKYVRFKRSSGSARVGKVLFIDERFYSKMHEWEMCGLKIEDNSSIELAGWEAYISLTTSSIIDTLEIHPENILLIDDYDSVFNDKVLAIDSCDGRLNVREDVIEITNSIWDGQSLIDTSLVPTYKDCYRNTLGELCEDEHQPGMVLLRSRMFKSAAFNTNIQKFFKDNEITSVEQLNGKTRAQSIEQIKLITTPNSIKYLKFGSYEQWLDNLEPTFGLVKTEHKTHHFGGRQVQVHYQALNTLQLSKDDMRQLLAPTIEYAKALRKKPEVLRFNINYPIDVDDRFYSNIDENDIVFTIMGLNSDFYKTKIFQEFAKEHAKSYLNNTAKGHVMVNGNYETLLGNPYEMLLQSIGKFDGVSSFPAWCIHTKNFEYGTILFGSRSPHPTMGNILLAQNVAHELIDKYFNLTNEIVCINSISNNIQQLLSGADMDSDTILLTDNPILVQAAQKNYDKFLVPTSTLSANKTPRVYSNREKADLDIKTSENLIGQIINLAQMLNSLFWHNVNNGQSFEENRDLYYDAAKLTILSGYEIDKAKRQYDISAAQEIDIIKEKYFHKEPGQRRVKPYFFGVIAKAKGYYDDTKNEYRHFDTSMDYLEEILEEVSLGRSARGHRLSLTDIMAEIPYDKDRVNKQQVKQILTRITTFIEFTRSLWAKGDNIDPVYRYQAIADGERMLIGYLSKLKINKDTVIRLIRNSEKLGGVKPQKILHFLFLSQDELMSEIFRMEKQPLPWLVFDEDGDIQYFDYKFSLVYK